MVNISALFGASNPWADLLTARAQIPGQVATAPDAAAVKSAIGSAARLDKTSKQTLSSLTDTVSKYAGNNPQLMRNIIGISNLMQIGAKAQPLSDSSPYAALLQGYLSSPAGKNFSIDV